MTLKMSTKSLLQNFRNNLASSILVVVDAVNWKLNFLLEILNGGSS